MQTCSNCRQDLQPGFDFCHHCGAAAQQDATAAPAQTKLVGLVADLEQIASRSASASNTASQTVSDWLGGPTSLQRRISYALLTGLAIILAFGFTPLSGLFKWLEGWLLLSLLTLPFISYWLTGFLPLSNVYNAILGDLLSLRRRLIVTFLWTTWSSSIVLSLSFAESMLSGESGFRALLEGIGVYAGIFLIVFYLMGQANAWNPIQDMEGSIFLDRMSKNAGDVSGLVCDQIQERGIVGLETSEIEMARLRHYTAGESSGRQGRQISFTRGRSQVVLFVQDFGHGLFIRWTGYFDASGRRLWILLGRVFRGVSDLVLRWTGTSLLNFWRESLGTLRPSPRGITNFMAMNRGDLLSRLFGLAEGISEYGWNEICALESSIKNTVVQVAHEAQDEHQEADAIESQMAIHAQIERHSRTGSQSPRPAGPQ